VTPVITKVCPECGSVLMVRTNRKTDTQFLGCDRWPECKHTEPIPETLLMRLTGAPELPLWDEETT
jgi:ssDNA-binding Zn-finger/Zn-ribbon topoisomerase 1